MKQQVSAACEVARILEALDLVPTLARRVHWSFDRFMAVEDLESYAREGLLLAARSYDPTRGVPFRAWATLRMRGAMIDGMRARSHVPRHVWRELRQEVAQCA
jgi:RNA polymerase sigma factor for flagellar operon FliA